MDELANQLGAGVIVAYLLEILKNSNSFKFLNQEHSGFYKGAIGFIAAVITTVGIHYTFDYNPTVGGQMIIVIPPLETAMHGIWDFFRQWAFQQASYDGLVRNSSEKQKSVVDYKIIQIPQEIKPK